MAGFRTFATGEVLTAANVNDFLMKQSVMVFDDATARTTALGAEVIEGMLTYNKDTDQLEVFDGTNFVIAAPEPPPPTPQNLVAVKSSVFTATQAESVTAGGNLTVNDIEIIHEVSDPENRLIISAFIGVAGHSLGRANVAIAVHDGTGLIFIGDAVGGRTRVTAGGVVVFGTNNEQVAMPSVTFVHTPGAGSKTYTVRAISIDSSTRTVFINRSANDFNGSKQSRGVSSLVITEVAV